MILDVSHLRLAPIAQFESYNINENATIFLSAESLVEIAASGRP